MINQDPWLLNVQLIRKHWSAMLIFIMEQTGIVNFQIHFTGQAHVCGVHCQHRRRFLYTKKDLCWRIMFPVILYQWGHVLWSLEQLHSCINIEDVCALINDWHLYGDVIMEPCEGNIYIQGIKFINRMEFLLSEAVYNRIGWALVWCNSWFNCGKNITWIKLFPISALPVWTEFGNCAHCGQGNQRAKLMVKSQWTTPASALYYAIYFTHIRLTGHTTQ